MADETPQPAPSPEGGGGTGGEQQAAAKPSGGLSSYLPLVIILVLMPVLAVGTMLIYSKMSQKPSGSSEAEPAAEKASEKSKEESSRKSEGGSKESKDSKEKGKSRKKDERNTKLPVPLTREAVAYHQKDPTKEGDYDKIVTLDLKGEPKDEAKSDKIVVNVANTGGSRFAVARLSLMGERKDFIEQVNLNRERMLDVASGALSSKTLDDIEKPGFRNLLRSELLALFNEQILGRGAIQEVIITEFVIQ